ncbi:MAG TPA: PDZ domain-containing protein [Virgibacillus sp.]|nr:PDZ domain-containing protein [Virgibacillus sp.]
MLETWGMEFVKGIGQAFLNPILYWWILLTLFAGWKRIREERNLFGIKIYDVFSEWKKTWLIAVISGLTISLVTLGIGIVLTWETILLLNIVVIILSITLRFTLLSPSYIIGITFLLLLFSPVLLENQSFIPETYFQNINFQGLAILLGLFLLAEAFQTRRVKRDETYPGLQIGDRGEWVGVHHIRKLSMIPFFVLVPAGSLSSIAPFWPYISIGDESYSIVLVPFLLGFDHIARGRHPNESAKKMGNAVGLLAVIVLVIATGGIYMSWLSLVSVLVALLGKELINGLYRVKEKEHLPYFYNQKQGVVVLAVIPGSSADRIGIEPGEMIKKVNGQSIDDEASFYNALQTGGAFFKLDVIDDDGEIRFVQSALYEGEHHELGIIFVKEPHRFQTLKHVP